MTIDFKHFITHYHLASSYEQAIKELFNDFPRKLKFDFLFLEFPERCIKQIKGNTLFDNHLFQLLDFYEYRFIELGKKERYPKVYYQIYYCYYLIFKKWGDELTPKDKTWIQKKWLTVCFNSLSDKALKHWLESKEIDPDGPIDVEKNVVDILFDKGGNIEKEFKDDKEMKFYASRAVDWFLKRYDWVSALYINKKRIGKKNKIEIKKIKFSILLILVNILLIFSLFYNSQQLNINPHLSTSVRLTRDILKDNAILGIPYYIELIFLVLIGIGILIAFIIALIKGFEFIRLLLPRLLGAVFIGFIPVVAGSEVYTFPLRLNLMQVSGISSVIFLIALIYLTVECYTMIGKRDIFGRALGVSLYGLFASLILSLFICDVLAVDFVDYTRATYNVGYKGLFGVIYPQIVIFFASAALLIGIFIQVFWEEKTITEPL